MATNVGRFSRLLMVLVAATLCTRAAHAQSRFDVGLLLGATQATDEGRVLAFDRATTYQATFAWRVWQGRAAALSVEVPFLASPAFEVSTPGPTLPKEYASLYLTPGSAFVGSYAMRTRVHATFPSRLRASVSTTWLSQEGWCCASETW